MSLSTANSFELLTPPGAAALAVVRVSGPAVSEFLRAHFSGQVQLGRATHGQLRDAVGELIDDPVVALLDEGRSAEICLHGGPWVVRAAAECLTSRGFVRVDPKIGFAKQGYLRRDPKNDGEQLHADPLPATVEELVMRTIPKATTQLGLQALLSQVKAWADFESRTGLEPVSILTEQPYCGPRLSDEIVAELMAIGRDYSLYHLLNPPTVAIVGPPNVGKSTLANALLGRDRSIVADLPGTTRDWVGEQADLAGLPVILIDTPGVRTSDDDIETQAIEHAQKKVRAADCVIAVIDATQPLEPQRAIIRSIRSTGFPTVINKCDQPPAFDLLAAGGIKISAQKGEGLDVIINWIHNSFQIDDLDFSKPMMF